MRVPITIFIFFCFIQIHSQNELGIELINDVEKNILIYRISENRINLNECRYGKPIDFERLLPSKNQSLNYTLTKSNLKYPNEYIELYEIKTKFNFVEETKLRDGDTIRDEIKFYTSDTAYIEEKFLIGYSKTNESIFYISGNFFKNCISKDFDLNLKDPTTFKEFLKLKLFSYGIEEIKFVKKRKNYLLFEGYPHPVKMKIKVDINNFDNIVIEECSK